MGTMSDPVDRLFNLRGSVAVVTGGGTGIGRAIALGLAEAGASVAVWGRRYDPLATAAQEIRQRGGRALPISMDVTDRDSVEQAFQETANSFGEEANILVNSAGTHVKVPALEMREQDWQRVFDVNVKGTFLACQNFARRFQNKRPGSIVNIASLSTFVAFPETAAYAASKAAIGQLTRSLASEWARAGIRVNAVAPGFFLTDLNKPILEGTERGAQAIARTPLGRLGELDELVAPVIYLCSPGASFVTGVIIPVDGGLLATGF